MRGKKISLNTFAKAYTAQNKADSSSNVTADFKKAAHGHKIWKKIFYKNYTSAR